LGGSPLRRAFTARSSSRRSSRCGWASWSCLRFIRGLRSGTVSAHSPRGCCRWWRARLPATGCGPRSSRRAR